MADDVHRPRPDGNESRDARLDETPTNNVGGPGEPDPKPLSAFDVIGSLGRAAAGYSLLLARQPPGDHLVILRKATGSDEPTTDIELITAVDSSLPARGAQCLSCGAALRDWRRFCGACGRDVSGTVEAPADGETIREVLEREVEGIYEVLGELPHREGGGAVYFVREVAGGRLLAVRVHAEVRPDGSSELVLTTAEVTEPEIAEGSPPQTTDPVATVTPTAESESREITHAGKRCPHCGTEYGTEMKFCPADGWSLQAIQPASGLVGQILAERYHILRQLGEGGMGRVYLAEHVKMGRQCAIKVMNPALASDPDAVARFSREAANASRITHPNVATIYDFGEAGSGLLYLAMEYVEGEPLSAIIKREAPLSPGRAVDLAIQVTGALIAAHEIGIVHRDLKPDNIMVGRARDGGDAVRLVDFGIAKALEGGRQRVTSTGMVVGTPEYISPEQLSGEPADARSDIYSVGCILYEMLVGKPAFAGPTDEVIVSRRLTEPPPHPRALSASVPRTLDGVVVRALARDPTERYQTATELREALAVVLPRADAEDGGRLRDLVRRGLRLGGPRTTSPAATTAASSPAAITDGETSATLRRRVGSAAVIGMLLLVAVVAGRAYWLVPSPAPEPPVPNNANGSNEAGRPPAEAVAELRAQMESGRLHLDRGELGASRQEYEQARDKTEALLATYPADPELLRIRDDVAAQLAHLEERLVEALREIEDHLASGERHFSRREFDLARREYGQAQRKTAAMLAHFQADEQLLRIRDRIADHIRRLGQPLAEGLQEIRAHLATADRLLDRDEYGRAHREFEQVRERATELLGQHPGNPEIVRLRDEADARIRRLEARLAEGLQEIRDHVAFGDLRFGRQEYGLARGEYEQARDKAVVLLGHYPADRELLGIREQVAGQIRQLDLVACEAERAVALGRGENPPPCN